MKITNLHKLFKFSWAQAFSDANGKSTVMPIAGITIIVTGCIGFLIGAATKNSDLLNQSVIMTTIGASVLVGRKIINGKPGELPQVEDDPKVP